jgi:hypothetical protein
MLRHAFAALLACIMPLAGCSKPQEDEEFPSPEDARTIVSVDNRGFLDMTIYVIDGTQRVRLGVANGNRVTDLTIPQQLVRGATHLQFLCDPIGGNRAPVSDEITVEPGDTVTLVIPAS